MVYVQLVYENASGSGIIRDQNRVTITGALLLIILM